MLAANLRRGGKPITVVSTSVFTEASIASGNIVMSAPPLIQAGDLLVMYIPSNVVSWTGDTGWTEVLEVIGGSGLRGIRVAYKVATSSEPATYTFTNSGSSTGRFALILCIRGATYGAIGSLYQGPSGLGDIVMPNVVAPQSGLLLGIAHSGATGGEHSTPPGMALAFSNNTIVGSSSVFTQRIGAGATGTRTSTPTVSATQIGVLISLNGA